MRTHFFLFQLGVLLLLTGQSLKAQDTIYKNNGTIIFAKITEIGSGTVSFKKTDFADGPTFVENKTDISEIRFRNGQHQEFVKVEVPQKKDQQETVGKKGDSGNTTTNTSTSSQNSTNTQANRNNSNDALKNGPVSEQHKIDEIDGKYFINGQKLGRRGLDRELNKSKNPLVQASLKTAKIMKISQKIVGLTSIPSTIGGGVTSIISISQLVTAYQTNSLSPKYYVNAGLSFLGTLSLPITSKYLKKQRDKLYNKTIDLYNMGN